MTGRHARARRPVRAAERPVDDAARTAPPAAPMILATLRSAVATLRPVLTAPRSAVATLRPVLTAPRSAVATLRPVLTAGRPHFTAPRGMRAGPAAAAHAGRTNRRRLVAGMLALGLAAGLPACSAPSPDTALDKFVRGLQNGDLSSAPVRTRDNQPIPPDMLKQLSGDLAGKKPDIKVGQPKVKDGKATATLDYTWPIATGVTWSYRSTVSAVLKDDDKWQVYFEPATLHPDLTTADKIVIKRATAERGGILDATGSPIVSSRPVITVGVQPNQVPNAKDLADALDRAFKVIKVNVSVADLPDRLTAAKPDTFVQVVTLREPDYEKIKAQVYPLPGVQFRKGVQQLAPSRSFARATLGQVDEVTKEIMDKNPGKYQIGDQVGLNGLQRRYDDVLRGTPGVSVTIPAKGSEGAEKVLFTAAPKAGSAIKTTLDAKTQNAADEALAAETRRSALVAVRVSDGAVLAVANGPGGGELDLALTAQVPPGSTFKAVTTLGVLDNGAANADTVVPCPKTLVVDGQTYQNAHGMVLGDVPLHQNFAQSCNTAFASLAPKLGDDGLAKAAAMLGIGTPWDIGADAYSGKVATGGGPAQQAAAAFGQGQTQVSPIALASAAAGIARGQWQQPRLVLEPAPAKPAAPGPQLKPEVAGALKQMMREVVTGGTADKLKGVAGPPVHGKTGTAEFDNDPSHTHSWFMGFRGDVAFAVFVENGGLSSDTAVPVASRFLTKLG